MSEFTMSAQSLGHEEPLIRFVSYAGFWKRVAAYLVDGIVFGIPSMIVFVAVTFMMSRGSSNYIFSVEDGMNMLILFLIFWIANWLYFAFMESSETGATLGKKALGLRVTDMNGNPVTFARASGRYFGKIVSGLIFYIGFMMAGFTDRKQALHDMMAGTLVLDVQSPRGTVPSNVAEQAMRY